MAKAVTILTAAALAAPLALAMPAFGAGFDGAWSVVIMTKSGPCDTAYRYPVKVDKNRVLYDGTNDFAINGSVHGSGAVSVSIRRGEQGASATGRLNGSRGAGRWTGKSSTGNCSGTWEAERR